MSSFSAAFSVDTSHLPVVDIVFDGALTESDCVAFFERLSAVCTPGERIATIVDLRGLNAFSVTAAIRQAAARAFFDGIDRRRAATICEARIVENALTRGIIVAFDWITGSKWPCSAFPTREAAVAWVSQQVEKDSKVRDASSSGMFPICAESGEPELRNVG